MLGHCFHGDISEAQGDLHSGSLSLYLQSREASASGGWQGHQWALSLEVEASQSVGQPGTGHADTWGSFPLRRALKALGPTGRTGVLSLERAEIQRTPSEILRAVLWGRDGAHSGWLWTVELGPMGRIYEDIPILAQC